MTSEREEWCRTIAGYVRRWGDLDLSSVLGKLLTPSERAERRDYFETYLSKSRYSKFVRIEPGSWVVRCNGQPTREEWIRVWEEVNE